MPGASCRSNVADIRRLEPFLRESNTRLMKDTGPLLFGPVLDRSAVLSGLGGLAQLGLLQKGYCYRADPRRSPHGVNAHAPREQAAGRWRLNTKYVQTD